MRAKLERIAAGKIEFDKMCIRDRSGCPQVDPWLRLWR